MVDGISWDDLLSQAGDVVATSFEPLPADEYELEVIEATHVMTKTSPSKNMWKIQSKVLSGTYANRRLWDNVVLTPDSDKALSFFFQKMGVMGLPREYFAQKPTNEAIASALKGRRFKAKIKQRTYQGEIQNEFDRYLAPIATPGAPGAVQAGAAPAAPPAGVPAPPAPQAAAPSAPPAPPAPAPQAAAPAPSPWETPAAPPAAPQQQYAPAPAPAAPPAAAPAAPAPSPQAGAVPPAPPLEGLPF